MKILALEFSSGQSSVAVRSEGRPMARVVHEGRRHTPALGMVDETLRLAGWEREDVECLVVGLGPGSYGGIRSAIALAQGWQLARGTRLLGLSTVSCLAAQAQAAGQTGLLQILIDA